MTSSQEPPINLLRGWPSSSLLPTSLIKNAATAALSNPLIAQDALSYGPDPGYEPARVAIAKWLTDSYATPSPITADRLCITGGASQNLGSLLSVYTDPVYTRNIWIIAPAYFLSFRIFEDAGFSGKMRAVPEDGEGLDIAFLEREIKKIEDAQNEHLAHVDTREGINSTSNNSAKNVSTSHHPVYKPQRTRAKTYKHIVYCVPSFANPSSRTMSMRRRKELVRLARRYDALLVADDVYDFLQWPAEDSDEKIDPSSLHSQQEYFPRLVDIDREIDGGAEREGADGFGNACSNGSFSKIAGPGVRCGWLEGTKKLAYGVSQT
jgi:DNA-binding transcriptional MocR family regulator